MHHARSNTDTSAIAKLTTRTIDKLTARTMDKLTSRKVINDGIEKKLLKNDLESKDSETKTKNDSLTCNVVPKEASKCNTELAKVTPKCKRNTSKDSLKCSPEVSKDTTILNLEGSLQPVNKLIDNSLLPIEEQVMLPADDVTDLREVVDAINKLCDTMKTNNYTTDEVTLDEELKEARTDYSVDLTNTDHYMYNISEVWNESSNNEEECIETACASEVEEIQSVETISETFSHILESQGQIGTEWNEPVLPETSSVAIPGQSDEVTSDGEPALNWEGAGSELYYTASSEVSLVSDVEIHERGTEIEDSAMVDLPLMTASMQEREEECVVAGHVAAMREKFESLTRSTTPCLDRAGTPVDGSRNVSPSPTERS